VFIDESSDPSSDVSTCSCDGADASRSGFSLGFRESQAFQGFAGIPMISVSRKKAGMMRGGRFPIPPGKAFVR